MNRKHDTSAMAQLAGLGAGAVGAGFVWLSVLSSNPQRIEIVRADTIQRVTQWAADSINSVLDTLPPELDAWIGIRWYDTEHPKRWSPDTPGSVPTRAVVLIHGLDEPGGIWDELAPALADEGHRVVRFEYPNDQRIAPSAYAFCEALRGLHADGVEQIDIVAHSMGGLVAREALSNPDLNDGAMPRTGRLITLGTPHLGSPWSRMRAVAEIREQVQRWIESDDMDPKRLLGFARDGVGQAGTDLLPGSEFLETLNARSLPSGVVVTCVVGRAVPFREMDIRTIAGSGVLEQLVGKRDADSIERELETLKSKLGDGVVPVSSAVMPGATDIVIVEANHRSMVRGIELDQALDRVRGIPTGPPPPAIRVILDRLGEPADAESSP